MRILTVNCGSSSLKFALFDGERRCADGLIERIGAGSGSVRFGRGGTAARVADHGHAMRLVAARLREEGLVDDLAAIGHRVVHGGERFRGPVRVDRGVLAELERLAELAPLHNPPALAALDAAVEELAWLPNIATFDTAFHSSMPAHASRYAIDPKLADRHGVRRYGFHGLAHSSMLALYARHSHRPPESLRLVTLQLGNGCSAAAIQRGRSVDTTMGLTPLEGLVMGTRSGDVDPTLVTFLARREGVDPLVVEAWLNETSGLRAVSGRSQDMRDILSAAAAGDAAAELAIEMFCHRVRKAVGGYLAVLGGADAIVFGGGIGANAAPIRAQVCAGLEFCGVRLDGARNAALVNGKQGIASIQGGWPQVFVASVDEERQIAADTVDALRTSG